MELFKKRLCATVGVAAAVCALSIGAVVGSHLVNRAATPTPATTAAVDTAAVKTAGTAPVETAEPAAPNAIETAYATASLDEISVRRLGDAPTVEVQLNLPAEKSSDVSILCMNPLYTKDKIDDWATEQDKVCFVEQIPLDEQGGATFQMPLGEKMKGAYRLAVGGANGAYMAAFSLVDPLNGWVNGVYYKDDAPQKLCWVENKYYTDANGRKTTDRVLIIGGKRYAFDRNGVRLTGSKWVTVGGATYYLQNGLVKPNAWVGKARTDKNGMKIQNSKFKVGKKTYIVKNGKKQTGKKLVTFKGKRYYVDKAGVVAVKKLVRVKGKRYFASKTGAIAVKKLVTYKGKRYYAGKKGVIAVKKTITYKGKRYYANKSGICRRVKR